MYIHTYVYLHVYIYIRFNMYIYIYTYIYTCKYTYVGESNGNLPLRTCPGCSVPEPYRSPDWVLVPAKPA